MVDRKLPDKSGGKGAGQGTFKDDGSVPKPVVPPKKPAPPKPAGKPGKKGPAPAGGKSAKPDAKAQSDQVATKALQVGLDGLKKNEPYSKAELSKALGALKTKVKGISFISKPQGDKWIVTASGGGKKKSAGQIELKMKKEGAISQGAISDEAQKGLAALDQVTERYAAKGATLEEMTAAIKSVRRKFKFKSLTVEQKDGRWYFNYEINPKGTKPSATVAGPTSSAGLEEAKKAFGLDPFTTKELGNLLGIALRTAQLRTLEWCKQKVLFKMRIEHTYTFDAAKVAVAAPVPGEHPSIDPNLDRIAWKIKPGVKIRDIYYKKNFRQDRLKPLLTLANTGKTNANGQELYKCAGGWGPNHIPTPTRAELEIDHKDDVSLHWFDEGRKTTQTVRNDWYDDPGHLVVLCGSCNASKKKGKYVPDVEIGFRGPHG
jgi:hypothetical protein